MVVLTLALTVVIGATAVVIDGGNAMTQHRATQNAADAASLAGALVIVQKLGGETRSDADVEAAVISSFADNAATMTTSYYVDFNHNIVGTVGRGGSIPTDAWGVRAAGERRFNTFVAGVLGFTSLLASAQATALAGALRGVCSAQDGCGVMPVTFSIPITTCDGTNRPLRMGVDWPIVSLDVALADQATNQYLSTVPLCTNGPGGVGWLDLDCGQNLADEINTPCNGPFDIPVWLHTGSGNMNNVDNELNDYIGELLLVPMFDATCREVPTTGLPADCTDPGNGDNLYYHIPRFAYFLLDSAFVAGDNSGVCNSPPGQPEGGGNGSTTCLKGWFVRYVTHGPVGIYTPCDGTVFTCPEESALGIQLVR